MHELEETPEGDVSGEEARREDEERQQDLSWDCAEIHYYTYYAEFTRKATRNTRESIWVFAYILLSKQRRSMGILQNLVSNACF